MNYKAIAKWAILLLVKIPIITALLIWSYCFIGVGIAASLGSLSSCKEAVKYELSDYVNKCAHEEAEAYRKTLDR